MLRLVRERQRAPTTRSCSSCATTRARRSSSTASPFTTYQAYNNYGGKSLYDFNSIGTTTVAGTAARGQGLVRPAVRAAAVTAYATGSRATELADRLLAGAPGLRRRRTPSNTDLEHKRPRLLSHKAYISPAHDEYWSAGMRDALEDGARRRRQPLLHGLERGLLEDPLRERRRRGQAEPRRGLLQDDRRAAARTPAASRPAPGATRRARTTRRTR